MLFRSQEEIRVTLQNYKDTEIVDLRVYWDDNPTKKGISLTHSVIEDVIKLLQKAFKKMQQQAESSEDNKTRTEIVKMLKRL